jgi:hypothetical protein
MLLLARRMPLFAIVCRWHHRSGVNGKWLTGLSFVGGIA